MIKRLAQCIREYKKVTILTLLFIVGLVGSYLAVIVIQGNFTEKELRRWFSSKRLPQFIQVRPIKFRGLWIHQ